MTEEQLQKAWQALFDGQYQLAKQLVSQIDQDNYSTLNLKAYIALEEKDFALARQFLKDHRRTAYSLASIGYGRARRRTFSEGL